MPVTKRTEVDQNIAVEGNERALQGFAMVPSANQIPFEGMSRSSSNETSCNYKPKHKEKPSIMCSMTLDDVNSEIAADRKDMVRSAIIQIVKDPYSNEKDKLKKIDAELSNILDPYTQRLNTLRSNLRSIYDGVSDLEA